MLNIGHSLNTPYSEAWYSPINDTVKVKVYRLREIEGQVYKEGFIFFFTQEDFFKMAEGMEFPARKIKLEKDNRFLELLEEISDE